MPRLLVGGSSRRTPFSSLPQPLWLSVQAGQQCSRKIKKIKSISLSQRALMRTIIAVLMNGRREIAERFRQYSLIEEPREARTKVSARAPIDTHRAFRRQKRARCEIQSHSEHRSRCIPAPDREAFRAFLEGGLNVCWQILWRFYSASILRADVSLIRKVWRNVYCGLFEIFIDRVIVAINPISDNECCRFSTFTTDREGFEPMFPPILDPSIVEVVNIECHSFSATPWAVGNNSSHQTHPENRHLAARTMLHVLNEHAAELEVKPLLAASLESQKEGASV